MEIQEREHICRWNDGLAKSAKLFLSASNDEMGERFTAFCQELIALAPKVEMEREADKRSAPAIGIGAGVRYRAIPLGRELEPFLEGLAGNFEISEVVRRRIERVKSPANLRLYISAQCPFCPRAVRQLIAFPTINEKVTLEIVDGEMFVEMAQQDKISAAPTLLLDEFRWTGSLRIGEITKIIEERNPANLSAESIMEMIEQKQAERLAGMMLNRGEIFTPVLKMLAGEKWDLRLGAMVALEKIAEKKPGIIGEATEALWNLLDEANNEAKGDIIYILGQSKNKKIIPRLRELAAKDCRSEVKEAISEALDELERN